MQTYKSGIFTCYNSDYCCVDIKTSSSSDAVEVNCPEHFYEMLNIASKNKCFVLFHVNVGDLISFEVFNSVEDYLNPV